MSGRARAQQKVMDTVEANGRNPKYRRSVQEQNGQYLLNIPLRACENMDLEKADELVVEVVGDAYKVYLPEDDGRE